VYIMGITSVREALHKAAALSDADWRTRGGGDV
jgi:hypothetical protein